MRIGIVCYPTFGGSGVVATELGKALADKGHFIVFITYSQPVRLEHFHENISYHEVRMPDYPLFEHAPYETALTSKMVDVVKYENLDLLHVHYAIPHASAAYLAKKILAEEGINIPFITTLHGTDITLVGRNSEYAPVVTFAINNSDGVTAVSESLKKDTLQNFKLRIDIKVIPNFIDLSRFTRQRKEHFRRAIAPFGEKLIAHTSNFRKVKRVEDVLHIFKEVRKEIPTKLLLIGDGPERQKLENLFRQLDICHDIRFLGKQEAIEEILSVCDLFLMPSETESFGLAALEAMACEVPVISSNSGGIPEVNIHGVTGFLSDVANVEEMAANALKLLNDDKMLAEFKKNALQQATRFDIAKILPQYEKFYAEILSSAGVHSV